VLRSTGHAAPRTRQGTVAFGMSRLYVAGVASGRSVTPGYVVVYPNRDKAASKTTKLVVALIMLVSVALMLILTIGGWSEFQGLKGINLIVCALYCVLAFYIFTRWARGLLPIAAMFGILLLMLAVVAGTGLAGTSWFNRSHFGFAPSKSLFGSKGITPDLLGLLTVLLIPVQILLIVFAMIGFRQGWGVEKEVPKDEAKRYGKAATA
jgi:lysylphosphatidylglycerol synthetase-like protein (DUF2156 family)